MNTALGKAPGSGSAYRPEIDGLRACAVVPVVLFHAGGNWLPGGFVGVDVFFVISGYLITGILLRDIRAGTFSFREFMTRRILRILPAFLTMIAVTLAATRCFVFRPDQQDIGRQATAALLSVANIKFWLMTGDYWGGDAAESPLLHTWSLSVEEQFYLCVPLALWALVRFAPRLVRGAILVSTVASFCLFLVGIARHHESATFYLLPTRAWELGVGACLAAFAPTGTTEPARHRPWRDVAALVGLGLILAAYAICSRLDWSVSIAVAGTALVLAFADSGMSRFLLTRPPLVWIGIASYSIYLWHLPIFVFSDAVGPLARRRWIVPLVFAIGTVSYLLIERHSRHNRRLLPVIAAGYVLVLLFAASLALTTASYDTAAFAESSYSAGMYDVKKPKKGLDTLPEARHSGVKIPQRRGSEDEYLSGGWIVGPAGAPRIVVLGDSHGCMWSVAIRTIVERRGITTSFYAAGADRPFVGLPLDNIYSPFSRENKLKFDEARKYWISRWKPDLVIVAARWSSYKDSDPLTLLAFLKSHARHVLLVEQPPELTIRQRSALQWLCHRNIKPKEGAEQTLPAGDSEHYYSRGREYVRALAESHDHCDLLETYDLFSRRQGKEVAVLRGANVMYFDGDHLTDEGVGLAVERFADAIDRLVPER